MKLVGRIASTLVMALAALFGLAEAASAQAAARPAVMEALMRDLAGVEEKLIGLAEAMPESAYGWRPGEGVRSVSEVMMHVAADNYFLPIAADVPAPAATGIKPNDYPSVQAYENRAATKAESIAAVRASFAHLRSAMQKADAPFMAKQLKLFGMDMTGMDLWVLTTTHLHEHLGQMIAYARSNNVVPPWSR
jgi:uncharacterized damage-inducible protein DinB